jgi:glycolate oxidase
VPEITVTPAVKAKLREIVGSEGVLDAPEDLITHAYDGTPMIERRPEAVVIPRSVEEVAAVVALANDADFKVVPRGAGSGLSGGSVPVDNCVVMLMAPRRQILEIDEANLTAWVEPGVITADIHSAVEAKGLFYPPDPGSMNICTIGGNVAEDSGGLRGLKYGVTHNHIMGLEVVTPTGDVLQTGGKAMKNVAGYRLTDVLVGSEGTLGIFTKILLRLMPKPQASQVIVAHFKNLRDSAEAVAGVIAAKITPAMMEFLDQHTIRCVEDFAQIGLPRDIGAMLLMEADGHPAVVAEEAEQIEAICKRVGAVHVARAADPTEGLKMKTARRSAFAALARLKPTTILEDATVPRSRLPEMVDRVEQIARAHRITLGTFGHAGDGNLHPTLCTDERDEEEIKRVESAIEEIFNLAIAMDGTITGEHGVGLAKRPFLKRLVGPPGIKMMQDLKQVMDPNLVLNPGKIIEPRPRREGRLPRSREHADALAHQILDPVRAT